LKNAEQQYLDLCHRLMMEGTWVENERTGKKCLTIINADLEYNVGAKDFPILTSKATFWKMAIAEIQGYLIGLDNAADFRALGTKTWDANANENVAWLNNPARKGTDDMGKAYGVVAKDFGGVDLIQTVYDNLSAGHDGRGEIISFWKPDEFKDACLRPCMYSHHFSILDGILHLHSTQRSVDVPLGLPFNMVQCYFLLDLMAKITGLKAGKCFHKLVNVHIYEDQLEGIETMLRRKPLDIKPVFNIGDEFDSLESLNAFRAVDICTLEGYSHQGRIDFPFSS
jgi:thymidylate synthase